MQKWEGINIRGIKFRGFRREFKEKFDNIVNIVQLNASLYVKFHSPARFYNQGFLYMTLQLLVSRNLDLFIHCFKFSFKTE